ncbi:MAG: hypothetical protein HQK75_10560 [Candidatus Magnetomorum sp.]|nr:hypothetical protein [Candidatus Magnetomorum sp.]
MLKICHNCSLVLPDSEDELIVCSYCGQKHTIYPSGIIVSTFANLLHHDPNLSVRVFLVLKRNVFSVNEFFKLNKNDFFKLKNCGIKTTNELIKFQKALHKKLFTDSSIPNIPDVLKYDNDFYEVIIEKVSHKMKYILLHNYQIDSACKIIDLAYNDCFKLKDIYYARDEIERIRDIITQISNVINSTSELNGLSFKEIIKKNDKIRDLMGIGMFVDPDNLIYSLNIWILGIAKNSSRNKDIFMKRFGMSGCPKMSYRKIAVEYNVSIGRIRQITERMKFWGIKRFNSIRLDPIIEKAADILEINEKQLEIGDLIKELLCCNQEGEQLKSATPFLEYLNTFPVWQKMGLSIKGEIVYLDESSPKSIKKDAENLNNL